MRVFASALSTRLWQIPIQRNEIKEFAVPFFVVRGFHVAVVGRVQKVDLDKSPSAEKVNRELLTRANKLSWH
jgi:hypothetical protein